MPRNMCLQINVDYYFQQDADQQIEAAANLFLQKEMILTSRKDVWFSLSLLSG